ncbi:peptidase inhibitor clitocypin domain-containing protein [Ceratobasidium sp. AG-Ba]|nr:peptidase inhibitor clitocypin domain-containing protein [Ceratobasidium sp. AG-Ba]QRW10910.1 peptidase inhibitor clitocypin domain-containing protein [Ceratobasidium sp. AG-Ba]
MSPLPSSPINLRYIPNVPEGNHLAGTEGGMYASAKLGLNKPLEVAAQVPGYVEYQTWRFGEPNNKSTPIVFIPQGEDLQIEIGKIGFHNNSEFPGTIVELSLVSDYTIEPVADVFGGQIVFIRPTGHLVGLDYYVGVDKNNHLEIQGFPIGTTTGLPGWFFRG